MLYLIISNVALSICLVINIAMGARERRYLTGLLASRDYAEFKRCEDGTEPRKYKTPISKREERERRAQELEQE